jgi:hypothetical protein
MEDEYQSTLKGKIKILYQLEKWQDVSKLCKQYNDQYGTDVEIDMIRFKSDRHLAKSSPESENKLRRPAPESPPAKAPGPPMTFKAQNEDDAPLLLTDDNEADESPAMLILDEIPAAEPLPASDEKLDYEPFPQANELVITDPYAGNEPLFTPLQSEPHTEANEPKIVDTSVENEPELSLDYNEPPPASNSIITGQPFTETKAEDLQATKQSRAPAGALIITDPYAEDEPVFNLPGDQPPVILEESGNAGKTEPPPVQDDEMAIIGEMPGDSMDTKIAFDFKGAAGVAFDAEPTLAPEPEVKSVARPADAGMRAPAAGPATQKSSGRDAFAEAWHDAAIPGDSEKAHEKPRIMVETENAHLEKPKSPKKFTFNYKTLLLFVLPLAAAVVLWLSLSGKLSSGGGSVEEVQPAPASSPRRHPAQKPTPQVTPPASETQIDENEKLVNEKIGRAESFFKKGDTLNALALVLEAKKIKVTEPLRLLEEEITKKIREDESKAAEEHQAVQDRVQSEEQAYDKAEAENTLPAWQNFLDLYPQGRFGARARNKIIALEKKAAQKVEQDFQLKIQQAQKFNLRSNPLSLTQADVNATLQRLGKSAVQFERLERGGEKVIVDFASGLMWTLWNKPMVFDKARWWANRIYAGYSGWRLPTVEEALSLLRMEPGLYSGLPDFAVWTADSVGDQVRSVWVLRLPQGLFAAHDTDQLCYVWAVRKAGR